MIGVVYDFCGVQQCFGWNVVLVEVDVVQMFVFDDGSFEVQLCGVDCGYVFVWF